MSKLRTVLVAEVAVGVDVIVDWGAMVAAHPEYLSSDGVHGTAAGNEARALAVDAAVDRCP